MVCGIQKDDEGPDAREDDEGPQEEAVHYHGHKLPILLQRVVVLLFLQLSSDVADRGNDLPQLGRQAHSPVWTIDKSPRVRGR